MKKILGERDTDAVLQRLDRLTQDGALTAATETLKVVHSLVQGIRVVMDGEQIDSVCDLLSVEYAFLKTAEDPSIVCRKHSVRLVTIISLFHD